MAYNPYGGGLRGWFESIPPVTRNLIIINLLIWIIEAVSGSFGRSLIDLLGLHFFWGFTGCDFNPMQLVTYMFIHDQHNFLHVGFNMFTLYMFGRIIEHRWGAKRFLLYYFVCGIGAALVQELVWYLTWHSDFIDSVAAYTTMRLTPDRMEYYLSTQPEIFGPLVDQFRNNMITIGASGAIFGILLAFAFMFPDMPLYFMFIPMPIKAKYMVAGYAVLEFFLGVSSYGGSVAHFAHLGGLLFGLIMLLWWRYRERQNNGGRRNPFSGKF